MKLKQQAIYKLYPQIVTICGDVAYDKDENIVEYDQAAVNAEFESNQYKVKRIAEYPSIGDQLDALFHAGVFPSDMAEQIQAIKDKYPKV